MTLDAELAARLSATAPRAADSAGPPPFHGLPAFEYIPGRIIGGTALPLINPELAGPKTGYFWAVQFIALNGLTAATETAGLFIGKSSSDIQLQNLFSPFSVPVAVGVNSWFAATVNPGRTDLILRDGESLIVAGTTVSTALVVRFSMIQAELRYLDRFLP